MVVERLLNQSRIVEITSALAEHTRGSFAGIVVIAAIWVAAGVAVLLIAVLILRLVLCCLTAGRLYRCRQRSSAGCHWHSCRRGQRRCQHHLLRYWLRQWQLRQRAQRQRLNILLRLHQPLLLRRRLHGLLHHLWLWQRQLYLLLLLLLLGWRLTVVCRSDRHSGRPSCWWASSWRHGSYVVQTGLLSSSSLQHTEHHNTTCKSAKDINVLSANRFDTVDWTTGRITGHKNSCLGNPHVFYTYGDCRGRNF